MNLLTAVKREPLDPIFLAGPTAVGKTAVALALAERLGGEILSVDSMQVYRGLDIGTAKPSSAERARVRAPPRRLDVHAVPAARRVLDRERRGVESR